MNVQSSVFNFSYRFNIYQNLCVLCGEVKQYTDTNEEK